MLQEQLDRVALMMEHTAPFTPLEAFVWRCLTRHVDMEYFERSGKITTPILSPEELLKSGESENTEYALADVQIGLDSLIAHGLLSVAKQTKNDSYRLFLPQSILSGNDVSAG